jgi:hypothetical protein
LVRGFLYSAMALWAGALVAWLQKPLQQVEAATTPQVL